MPSASMPRVRSSAFTTAGDGQHGFLYSGGTYTTLDDPLGVDTHAYGINDAAQIVGSYFDGSGGSHSFLLSGGSYTTLDDPLATQYISAYGINNTGQIVGSYEGSSSGSHGFLATPVIGSRISAQHGQSFAASSLFTASDPDGDTITRAIQHYLGHRSIASTGEIHRTGAGSVQRVLERLDTPANQPKNEIARLG